MSVLDRFLNTTGTAGDVTIVDPSNPVQVVGLAASIVGSVFVAIAMGALSLVDGVLTAITAPLAGVTDFLAGASRGPDGLLGLLGAAGSGAIRAAFDAAASTFGAFGPLAFPVAVASTLAALIVVAEARERLRGGR